MSSLVLLSLDDIDCTLRFKQGEIWIHIFVPFYLSCIPIMEMILNPSQHFTFAGENDIKISLTSFSDIDECESNPCQNNGTCTDGIASISCNCSEGWIGSLCGTGKCMKWLRSICMNFYQFVWNDSDQFGEKRCNM